jgi:acetolactate synthase II small subunit
MTKHTLKIEFESDEGALVRLLGLIQRRGFTVLGVSMPETAHRRKIINLTVTPMDAIHRIEVLLRQIARLYEVRAVELVTPRPPHSVFGFLKKRPVVSLQGKAMSSKGNPSCSPESSSHAS